IRVNKARHFNIFIAENKLQFKKPSPQQTIQPFYNPQPIQTIHPFKQIFLTQTNPLKHPHQLKILTLSHSEKPFKTSLTSHLFKHPHKNLPTNSHHTQTPIINNTLTTYHIPYHYNNHTNPQYQS
ncbi:antibiotic biosynthesis monooxygenase family protein, partial [Staphylococcus auricularis]|uniref:hypothetical protein n=1 Tax=Staphylococcus auricularis TaxID=29379 RepID=UPI001CD9BE0F